MRLNWSLLSILLKVRAFSVAFRALRRNQEASWRGKLDPNFRSRSASSCGTTSLTCRITSPEIDVDSRIVCFL